MEAVRKQLHAEYAKQHNLTGKNITVAVLDSGVWGGHPDLYDRLLFFNDLVKHNKKPYDDNSHGSHVSGIICGTGKMSRGRYQGIAPESRLIMLKVLDKFGNGDIETMLKGIDWVIRNKNRYQIRILNLSVGGSDDLDGKESIQLQEKVEEAWNLGIVVVAAAGNNGPAECSVTVPGNSPKVITVGSSKDAFGVGRKKKQIFYAGRGPTIQCVMKPEIVAPADAIVSCSNNNRYYSAKSGTSMAAPIVSGAVALLLEKEPKLTPKEVKRRLMNCAIDLGLPSNQQGWGMLDIERLLK